MSSKFINLLKSLKEALRRFEEVMKEEENEFIRDSAIQRFEFTYELSWKTIKAYLEEKGIKELYSPKDVFKAGFQEGLIDDEQKWVEMIETRNKTSHLYKESMAEEVYLKLPVYLKIISELIGKLA